MVRMIDVYTFVIPIELNVKYKKNSGEPVSDHVLCRTLVGSLIYLTTTQPDISYAVQIVSRFMYDP